MIADNNNFNTVELTPEDFDKAANLLATAFFENPSHIYIFPDKHNRLKAIQWTLKHNLNLNLNSQPNIGRSFAFVEPNQTPGKREIKAMAFWNPPQSDSVSLFSMVKEGLLIMPFRFGWGSLSRMVEVLEEMSAIKKRVLDRTPAWYLNNMVVAPELRGQGIGTKLLREQLLQVVDPSGFPAILMTQKKENVRFYERLGFKVMRESIICRGDNAFVNWCLLRESAN